jgi:hypothetical protein
MSTAPNLLAEAIGIADGSLQIPVHEGHLRAMLKGIPLAHARRFLNGEVRCTGCQEWFDRDRLTDCPKCPDPYCGECKTDHAEYCK